ncbi:MAG: flagellar biosynthesis protein FlhF [Phycisphaerales bacterium]|nr:flagellar biosynthesis protein FlhF [Phycisphaerales bacterium]
MKARTYLANTMDEAIAAVRRDLGSDAVILETRTSRRGGVLGLFARSIIELRAATALEVRASRRAAEPMVPGPAHAQQAYVQSSTQSAGSPRVQRLQTKQMAKEMLATLESSAQQPTPGPSVDSSTAVMQEELGAIRGLVERVLQGQAATSDHAGAAPVPDDVLDVYTSLIGQEVSDELAREVIESVSSELTREELSDPDTVRRCLVKHLSEFIPVSGGSLLAASPDERPLTLALVGPTGVGKTTTVAKIAAAYRIRQNRTVGLITLDTYRIAAIEQLRTYADIIGVPMSVARHGDELAQALDDMKDLDVVLIDTAGRSQKDVDRIKDLADLLAIAKPHQTHLVLAGTASRSVLLNEAEEFSRVGIDRIVLTKLDEAVCFGMLVDVVHRIGADLSFLTTGQEVPDHIETARPARLAELVVGDGVAS